MSLPQLLSKNFLANCVLAICKFMEAAKLDIHYGAFYRLARALKIDHKSMDAAFRYNVEQRYLQKIPGKVGRHGAEPVPLYQLTENGKHEVKRLVEELRDLWKQYTGQKLEDVLKDIIKEGLKEEFGISV